MPEVVFEVVAPLFGIILAGYVCGRMGLMGEGAGAALNQFVFAVSFPALILVTLSNTAPDQFFDWPFIGTLTGGMLAMFIVGAVVSRAFFRESLTATALHSLSVMFSSTGYIGLPLVLIAYGEEALPAGVFGAVVTVTLFLPLGLMLAEYERSEEKGIAILRPLGRSLQNPLLIATAAGLAMSAAGWSLPPAVAAFGEVLGGAYVPCALFAAGLYYVHCSVEGDVVETSWLVIAKLGLHPLITWLLAIWVFDLSGDSLKIAVLLAALPTGVPILVLAHRYGVFVDRSTAAIVLSTAASFFTVSALLITLS